MCAQIFRRIMVRPRVAGGTVVEWQFLPGFADPAPHHYQLQYSRSAAAPDGEWEDVGLEARDVFFLVDDEQRDYGSLMRAHYRVRLRTPRGVYFSPPQTALDGLPWFLWRQWRAQLAYHTRRLSLAGGIPGRFYKRRISGPPCPVCQPDMLTGEVLQPNCPACFGTTFAGGYFAARPCQFLGLIVGGHFPHQDPQRGPVDPLRQAEADMLAEWLPETHDVWVSDRTDHRYFIHAVQTLVGIGGRPVIYQVQLYQAPFSHIIYQLP